MKMYAFHYNEKWNVGLFVMRKRDDFLLGLIYVLLVF